MSREVDGRLRRFRSSRLERILSGENLIDAAAWSTGHFKPAYLLSGYMAMVTL
ncbi:hypothetical protein [Marinomonas polaris]|uniref:hypothetical protein n=1 Tax=Marinomonas polaris TaxID=293552 RepID=UPI001587BEDD|nr:hypothetical protein [Marinomonas polaris]